MSSFVFGARLSAFAFVLLAVTACDGIVDVPDEVKGISQLVATGEPAPITPTPTVVPATPTPPVAGPTATPTATPLAPPLETESVAQRGQRVMQTLAIQPGDLGFTIAFHRRSGGYRGLTFAPERHIDIFIDQSMSDEFVRHVIAHELGHAVDVTRFTLDDESTWRQARGFGATTPWWPDGYASDFATPAGDFAECFAFYLAPEIVPRSQQGSCAGTQALVAQLIS